MPLLQVLEGDCRKTLRSLPAESVHCCVTSPPYYLLRDYGHGGQIGLEKTPTAFITELVSVFDEVRRVLRKDGTIWVNMGDSYAGSGRAAGDINAGANFGHTPSRGVKIGSGHGDSGHTCYVPPPQGWKTKDLMGMPWRLAFALQEAGWYLRQDIIWHKPNPMPESVTDRCTKAHEYIFLLSKSERYHYDALAIRERVTGNSHARGDGMNPKAMAAPTGWDMSKGAGGHGSFHKAGRRPKKEGKNSRMHQDRDPQHPKARKTKQNPSFSAALAGANAGDTRNKRSVWTVATAGYAEAHFATFPPELITPCILAGCPARGVVLDPFGGSGTTGKVALELGRKAILCEINPQYIALIKERCTTTVGLNFEP